MVDGFCPNHQLVNPGIPWHPTVQQLEAHYQQHDPLLVRLQPPMAAVALSDSSCDFTALNSVLRMPYLQEGLSEKSMDGLGLPDLSSNFYSPLESWNASSSANIPLDKSSTSQMQDQSQQLPNTDLWSWNFQQPTDMTYPNLDIDASGFAFNNVDTSYSLFNKDQDTWSGASSPTSKTTTPKENNFSSFSGRRGSGSSPAPHKPKAIKGERLEKRREKNRTSQRRYRERKEKYIHDLENQCKKLRERNDSLCARLVNAGGEIFPYEEVPVIYEEKERDADSLDGDTEFN